MSAITTNNASEESSQRTFIHAKCVMALKKKKDEGSNSFINSLITELLVTAESLKLGALS